MFSPLRVGILLIMAIAPLSCARAQESSQVLPNPHGFKMSLWAREPLLTNPVALSFDDQGRLYVVETNRRGTVDLDIRAHKDWAYDDLHNQSIAQLRLFFWDKMAPEKSAENSGWLLDRNEDGLHDWADLMTKKERVYRLADTDGDGVADESTVFYEGFDEEFNGVIAGVLPWQDNVWVTVYPDLWQFQDKDDDGVADQRRSRYRGFGVHAAYDGHDIHGLTLGPEGKLYFSVGDNGFSVVTLEGQRLHYPNTGGVLRMNPDGSELEVFAYGLRNVQEIAFDDYGNLFSVDNDGDIEDERERFVYITEGSDSGWRINWQFRNRGWTRSMDQPLYNPWIHEQMWIPYFVDQPAHITPALSNYSVGPGGFKYNPGTALNDSYRGYFFLAQFPVQKITAFRAQQRGASFEMVDEHVFHFGLMASAMNFGPDGAMYIADWDGKWQPNDRGAIHRLDDPAVDGSPVRREVERLLREGFSSRSLPELSQLLGHADRRIRQRAQGALAARHAGNTLIEIARSASAQQLARVHALWGLIEMKGDGLADLALTLPFNDKDPEIRAQAAKVAGELNLSAATPWLIQMLTEEQSPRSQFHAGIALGKIQADEALSPLVSALSDNNDEDAYLRHAYVMGLAGCASQSDLAGLREHASSAVRVGAVLALRRLHSDRVLAFLHDSDRRVQREAVRAIHDDFSIPRAMPDLAALLDSSDLPAEEAIVRRSISANLRLGRPSTAQRLVRYALNANHPTPLRQEAVESLRVWNQRPYLDRVEGRARNLVPRDPQIANELLQKHALELLGSADDALSVTITQAIRRNGLEAPPTLLFRWLEDRRQEPAIRIEALRLIADKVSARLPEAITLAMASQTPSLRLAALEVEAEHSPASSLGRHNEITEYTIAERQELLRLLANTKGENAEGDTATALIETYVQSFGNQTLPETLRLDVVQLASRRSEPSVVRAWQRAARSYSPALESVDYRFSLVGGDVQRGKVVYETHVAAQCVRCHNAGGVGKQVGPVLDGIGSRVDAAYLLQSLLEPSAVIAPGFQTVSIETTDGESYDGVISAETDETITLALPIGGAQEVNKSDIHSRRASQLSSMPSMNGILTPFEIRDLVAFLGQL